MPLDLTADELLTTTRAVRRRLDLTRPVERAVIEECITIAQQAPSGSNAQPWHFVVVTDQRKRSLLADLYRKSSDAYFTRTNPASVQQGRDPRREAERMHLRASAKFLADHIQEVPVHVIPCFSGRTEGLPACVQAAMWGSIVPATWSFMLALRARGLGSAYTTFHLNFEEEVAKLLDIPFAGFTQAALVPVAYTRGTIFKPGPRRDVSSVIHWDGW
ncbi:MAG: nitroreductase family protein [Nitrososphaerota archaeon]|nr:nitroreductase family protein [Nitrososphaerota archaeon]